MTKSKAKSKSNSKPKSKPKSKLKSKKMKDSDEEPKEPTDQGMSDPELAYSGNLLSSSESETEQPLSSAKPREPEEPKETEEQKEPKEPEEPKETKDTKVPQDTTDLSQLSESEKMKIPTIREQEKAEVDKAVAEWSKRNSEAEAIKKKASGKSSK